MSKMESVYEWWRWEAHVGEKRCAGEVVCCADVWRRHLTGIVQSMYDRLGESSYFKKLSRADQSSIYALRYFTTLTEPNSPPPFL